MRSRFQFCQHTASTFVSRGSLCQRMQRRGMRGFWSRGLGTARFQGARILHYLADRMQRGPCIGGGTNDAHWPLRPSHI